MQTGPVDSRTTIEDSWIIVAAPRVLLVYPDGGEIGMLGEHPFYAMVGMYAHMPPLALATVAGYMPDHWELRIIDENVDPVTDEDLGWADYVFLSGMYPHKDALCRLAQRASDAGKHVIAGGPFISGSWQKVRGKYGIRTLCLNEVEPYVDRLVADIERGELEEIYGEEAERPDMKTVAVPRFDLVPNIDKYAMVSMQVSRGCPFDCEFCDVPTLVGRKMRYKTPDQVVAELDALRKVITNQGVQVFICDDNLTGHLKRCRDVLEAIAQWGKQHGYPFTFITQLSLNVADDKPLLDLLYEANVRTIITGIESANEASLLEAKKKHNLRRSMEDRIEDLIRAGIEVYAYLVVGFDNDPEDVFEINLDFVQRSKITYAETSILVAMDNTALGERVEREGRLLFNTATDANRVMENYAVGMTNFVTKLEPRRLQTGYARLLNGLVEPEAWYERTRQMVELLPERDREHHMISLRFRPDTIFIALCCLMYLPRRWLLLKHFVSLARKSGLWRAWRFLLSVFAVGLTRPEYVRKVERVERYQSEHEASDPMWGQPMPTSPLRVLQ